MEISKPLVSVVMSVYNTDVEYLRSAIDSMLLQTYKNIEIILVNDSSTDEDLLNYLDKLNDTIIIRINNTQNKGLAYSLNKGILASRGKYIARMDTDDVSMPERIENQVRYMEKNENIVVLATRAQMFGNENGCRVMMLNNPQYIAANFLFSVGITHPSVMLRKSVLIKKNLLYNESFRKAQDYELWSRISELGDVIYELPQVLLKYRISSNQASAEGKNKDQKQNAEFVKIKLLKELGIEPSGEELILHEYLSYADYRLASKIRLCQLFDWRKKIIQSNKISKKYSEKVLKMVLASHWLDSIAIYYKHNKIELKYLIKSLDIYFLRAVLLRLREKHIHL